MSETVRTDDIRWSVYYVSKEHCLGQDLDLMTASKVKICATREEADKIAAENSYPKRAEYWQPRISMQRKYLVTFTETQWREESTPTESSGVENEL